RITLGVGLVAATAVAAILFLRPRPAPSLPVHATLPAPEGARIESFYDLQSLAVSPDGRTVVFGADSEGASWLYQRPLGGAAPVQIQGTRGAYGPFFSPDGQWIGFFAHGELKKVPLSGGAPVFLAHLPPVIPGGTWGSDGRIVYTRGPNGELWWIAEAGGGPRPPAPAGTAPRGPEAPRPHT